MDNIEPIINRLFKQLDRIEAKQSAHSDRVAKLEERTGRLELGQKGIVTGAVLVITILLTFIVRFLGETL